MKKKYFAIISSFTTLMSCNKTYQLLWEEKSVSVNDNNNSPSIELEHYPTVLATGMTNYRFGIPFTSLYISVPDTENDFQDGEFSEVRTVYNFRLVGHMLARKDSIHLYLSLSRFEFRSLAIERLPLLCKDGIIIQLPTVDTFLDLDDYQYKSNNLSDEGIPELTRKRSTLANNELKLIDIDYKNGTINLTNSELFKTEILPLVGVDGQ